jgi:hypothetical protein
MVRTETGKEMLTLDDQVWVITDPGHTVIYGLVCCAASEHDALLAVINDPVQMLLDGYRRARPIEAVPAEELVDGRWREMAPLGPGSQGDCGGDVQCTNSFSRRFAMAKPDGLWAVYSTVWYGINESVEYVTADTEGEVLERQEEFLIVDDLRDLDVHLWWNDNYTKDDQWEPTDEGAREAAEKFVMDLNEWDGEQF